jgi:uncharacterized lipoprotein YddW (UPF0748 family)
MDREYPEYDYCYDSLCVANFKAKTGIDILSVEDPSQVEEWKQFRYDLITNLVNRLSDHIHAKGKEINAAVFPGPQIQSRKRSSGRSGISGIWTQFTPCFIMTFYLEKPEWIGDLTKRGS